MDLLHLASLAIVGMVALAAIWVMAGMVPHRRRPGDDVHEHEVYEDDGEY